MTWTFLKQVRARRSPTNTKLVANKRPRIRYRRDRLLDLLCTMKRRTGSTVGDHSTYSDKNTELLDTYSSLQGSNIWESDTNPASYDPTCSTLIDLLQTHSSALRKPIPPIDVTSTDSRFVSASDKIGRPAFCPSCQHMVFLLPQKRQGVPLSEDMDFTQQEAAGTYTVKRRRSDTPHNEDCPPMYVPLMANHTKKSRTSTLGHFNPTYTPCCKSIDSQENSIYAEVCDTELDCSIASLDTEFRQKRKAVRRLPQQHHHNCNDSFDADCQSAMDTSFFGGFDCCLPDQPWMSSTLRSRAHTVRNSDYDAQTLYDDVASDCESELEYIAGLKTASIEYSDVNFRFHSPVELMGGQFRSKDEQFLSDIKRVRREYFLCEE